MAEHSPGPWKEGASHGALKKEVLKVFLDGGSRAVATVWVKEYHKLTGKPVAWPEGEANLRAILLVPELLEALKALADAIDDYTIEVGRVERDECEYADQGDLYERVEQARALLAHCGAGTRD